MVETTKEELLFDTSPALFSKLLIRHCHDGSLKKTSFLQKNYKSLTKGSFELVALVILRVPPLLTVALLNFYLFQQRTSHKWKVVSLLTSMSSLGFPGGSLGWLGASWR